MAEHTNADGLSRRRCATPCAGADVFIGVSAPNILTGEDIATMADGAIVFALANPVPEVDPAAASEHAAVVASGRSDFANQINNVLAFPGVFRGLLDAASRTITVDMLLAAARALADVVTPERAERGYIVPSVFHPDVASDGGGRRQQGGARQRTPRRRRWGSPRRRETGPPPADRRGRLVLAVAVAVNLVDPLLAASGRPDGRARRSTRSCTSRSSRRWPGPACAPGSPARWWLPVLGAHAVLSEVVQLCCCPGAAVTGVTSPPTSSAYSRGPSWREHHGAGDRSHDEQDADADRAPAGGDPRAR